MVTHSKTTQAKWIVTGLLGLFMALAVLIFAPQASATGPYTYTRPANFPPRTIVTNAGGQWVATFTDNARTVTLLGASRTFTESTAAASVITTTWVRVLAQPFNGTVDETWLTAALADTSPDILALSMQYVAGAPAIISGSLQIAGDANYGPLSGTVRLEGSDFNDYLQIPWTYDTQVDNPEADQALSLDCSGYIRMLFGYRSSVPLTNTVTDGIGIPRRAYQIYDSAPGLIVITNTGTQVTDFSRLAAGDLVFFDADDGDGTQIDHVGMYVGRDTANNYRFISSRKTANGPTLGDTGGRSTLNGSSSYYWPKTFRAVRRF